jgi:hypothetical protein
VYQKGRPISVTRGSRVSVRIAFPDSSDGPPEVVIVFGCKPGNKAIGHRHIDQCEKARALPQIQVA